jgi:hypothetical protein
MSGLVQLVSRGEQDRHLNASPEISFWRQNYKRYSNFSIKPERLDFIGTFGANQEVTIPIRTKGDLLSYVWIEYPEVGSARANTKGLHSRDANPTEFSLWIGGQKVVEMDSLFVQGVNNVLYRGADGTCAVTTNDVLENAKGTNNNADHYIIPFFFSKEWTKCLPLIAMQYSDVEIRIKCRPGLNVGTGVTPKVYANFVYLDVDEREFFAKTEHELLITQVQHQPAEKTDREYDLTYFNHPCMAFHICSGESNGLLWSSEWSFDSATMYVNGIPLFENMSKVYHHTVVAEKHTSGLPTAALDGVPVYTWPAALNLDKSQPSGSLNMSRVDTAKIVLQNPTSGAGNSSIQRLYAVNWNILRIKNGLAGVAYGN